MTSKSPVEGNIVFEQVPSHTYDNFVHGWDTQDSPVFAAVSRTEQGYLNAYGIASFGYGVIDENAKKMPSEHEFEHYLYVTVAESVMAPEEQRELFIVDQLVGVDGELHLHYHLEREYRQSTFSINAFTALKVDDAKYSKLKVYRDGELVVELPLKNGEGRFPSSSEE
ncbi:hypothetical protein [Vibrio sp. SCSIO 43136]|uniref:hypothetical protein n=1 Tax=Vibrio sp. SCSIO 43136 TaxID=2819101 RepID=UPI0020757B8B|nr:hypothetical protein [Vibrio sp. SCSIO 43136]USD64535.1 hypothetical protein J4N39_10530 [Vibrio sp. SCSIO 43136]